jgi:hypothetical protein
MEPFHKPLESKHYFGVTGAIGLGIQYPHLFASCIATPNRNDVETILGALGVLIPKFC